MGWAHDTGGPLWNWDSRFPNLVALGSSALASLAAWKSVVAALTLPKLECTGEVTHAWLSHFLPELSLSGQKCPISQDLPASLPPSPRGSSQGLCACTFRTPPYNDTWATRERRRGSASPSVLGLWVVPKEPPWPPPGGLQAHSCLRVEAGPAARAGPHPSALTQLLVPGDQNNQRPGDGAELS